MWHSLPFALLSVLVISILLVNRYRVKNRANRMIEMERMRNTIARDLHDDIGSTLSSINIMSQLALNGNGNCGSTTFKENRNPLRTDDGEHE
jgi:two-component system sensor histidine kinase UhpB